MDSATPRKARSPKLVFRVIQGGEGQNRARRLRWMVFFFATFCILSSIPNEDIHQNQVPGVVDYGVAIDRFGFRVQVLREYEREYERAWSCPLPKHQVLRDKCYR